MGIFNGNAIGSASLLNTHTKNVFEKNLWQKKTHFNLKLFDFWRLRLPECGREGRDGLHNKWDVRILLESELDLIDGDLLTRDEERRGDAPACGAWAGLLAEAGAAKHLLLVLLNQVPHVVLRILEANKRDRDREVNQNYAFEKCWNKSKTCP